MGIFGLAMGLWVARGDEGRKVAEFKARAGNMTATAISDDGKLLFTGEDDGLVTLWNVGVTGTSMMNFVGHSRWVCGAALLPDGRRGVTCGDDNLDSGVGPADGEAAAGDDHGGCGAGGVVLLAGWRAGGGGMPGWAHPGMAGEHRPAGG